MAKQHADSDVPEMEVGSSMKSRSSTIAVRNVIDITTGFILMFNTWGIANSFGLFQTYYESSLLQDQSESTIAWIGSMQNFLLLFSGILIGPIYDAGHGRLIIAVGSFMIVFGLMMTSLCSVFWQVLLAQGVCVGIGFGCLVTPALAMLIEQFPNRANIAVGVATSGGSIGGVIYPILLKNILPTLGFPWSTRVLAFMVLGLQCLALATLRPKSSSETRRPFFDGSMIHNKSYCLFTLSAVFGFMGIYIPFYFIQTYSEFLEVDATLAFYSLVILNASSTAGRILPNLFAHIPGPMNTAIMCTLACSILNYAWIAVKNTPGLIVFCIFYGFFSGTFVSIIAPAISTTSKNPDLRGTHLGMSFSIASLGVLIGNPIAGVLLSDVSWTSVQSFAASTCMFAAVLMIASRLAITGPRLLAQT